LIDRLNLFLWILAHINKDRPLATYNQGRTEYSLRIRFGAE